MPTVHTTLAQLSAGLSLATGAHHTIVIPPQVVRARMVGLLFETDKTFVLPTAMPGLRRIKQIYDEHVARTVLVSGHADRAGTDAHNLALSVERAQAMAAFLRDDAADWLPRYQSGHQQSLAWGTREDQHMLSLVTGASGGAYFRGPVTGRSDAATRDAIHRFQDDSGLARGAMNAGTRDVLIQRYMATDGTTLPDDAQVVVHGCGESHPSVATADSVALPENRRVELFFFRGPANPPPVSPCPSGGCAEYPQWVERARQTIDINTSPEVVVALVDEIGLPLRNAAVRLLLPDGRREEVRTDGQGAIRPRVAPGSSFDVVVLEVHEGGADDSLTTPSGQHFEAGGVAPAASSGGGS